MEEDAIISAIVEEDTFLSLNTKVEVMGMAELEEICGRGPDWSQERKGGVKAGDSKDQDVEKKVISVIRIHTHSINNCGNTRDSSYGE